jgi:hypothetical protein
MDKLTTGKLALLLDGLGVRLTDDFNYLEEIRGVFTSGIRQTAFFLHPEDASLRLKVGAANKRILPAEFPAAILSEAARQDSMRMEIVFRGTALLLEAGAGKTSLKTIQGEAGLRDESTAGRPGASGSSQAGHAAGSTPPAHLAAGGLLTNRDYLVKPGQADKLLREIGIMAENGKIRNDRIRK